MSNWVIWYRIEVFIVVFLIKDSILKLNLILNCFVIMIVEGKVGVMGDVLFEVNLIICE